MFYTGIVYLVICLLSRRRAGSESGAVILFFHRFTEGEDEGTLRKLSVSEFKRQLKHLNRWYKVVTLDEVVERVKSGRGFSRPTIAMTIDDGFRDNYQFAFRVLINQNIPATIFLTSGLIGTLKAPWVDEIGIALDEIREETFYFPELFGDEKIEIGTKEKRSYILHIIYEKLLRVEHELRQSLLDGLLRKLRTGKEKRQEKRTMLNWEEVREMHKSGVSFGAHTLSHPTLSMMSYGEATREIIESKKIIEKEVGVKVKHFAIPNGKNEDFSDELKEFCKRTGFDSVLTTNCGVVTRRSDCYQLPRVSLEGSFCEVATGLVAMFLKARLRAM